MIAFLEREHLEQAQISQPARIAHIQVIVRGDSGPNELTELLVDLDQSAVVQREILVGKHSFIDSAYMKDVENACMADERVQHEVGKLRLPEGASVVVEPWAYATDGMNDMSERTSMVSTCPDDICNVLILVNIRCIVLVLYATGGQPRRQLLRIST